MKDRIINNYNQLLKNIERVALDCGRCSQEINLVAVTKGQPLESMLPLYEAGCRHFGESRIQEALLKKEKLPPDIHWHLIGNLQKNKVSKAIDTFDLIQSVDSLELATKISKCANEKNVTIPILLEVNISGEFSKHGFTEIELLASFQELLNLPGIAIKGLMGMGPISKDENLIESCFHKLKKTAQKLENFTILPILSMGMSHDYELAIREGATMLRVGSFLFKS